MSLHVHVHRRRPARDEKMSKVEAKFEHPARGPNSCGECVNFTSPGCKLVAGDVAAKDWCKLWKWKLHQKVTRR
jgi:hypothetical protein